MNPVALNVLKYMPLPNTQGAAFTNANNYYASGSGKLDIDQIDGRFDHNFTSNQRIFIRVSKRNQDDEPAVLWPAEIALAEDGISPRLTTDPDQLLETPAYLPLEREGPDRPALVREDAHRD